MRWAPAAAIGLAAYLARRSTKLSKQHVIDLLNRDGYTQLAEEATRELPDTVDVDRISAWLIQHGVGFLAPNLRTGTGVHITERAPAPRADSD
jgi:hypothetical protein